jgi:hypothetical protein
VACLWFAYTVINKQKTSSVLEKRMSPGRALLLLLGVLFMLIAFVLWFTWYQLTPENKEDNHKATEPSDDNNKLVEATDDDIGAEEATDDDIGAGEATDDDIGAGEATGGAQNREGESLSQVSDQSFRVNTKPTFALGPKLKSRVKRIEKQRVKQGVKPGVKQRSKLKTDARTNGDGSTGSALAKVRPYRVRFPVRNYNHDDHDSSESESFEEFEQDLQAKVLPVRSKTKK